MLAMIHASQRLVGSRMEAPAAAPMRLNPAPRPFSRHSPAARVHKQDVSEADEFSEFMSAHPPSAPSGLATWREAAMRQNAEQRQAAADATADAVHASSQAAHEAAEEEFPSCSTTEPRALTYSTIMLKLSGEALSGERGFGVDPDIMNWIAQEVAEVAAAGVKIAVVVGGGNYFRGATAAHKGLERATADYVGMLATVMNSLQLQAALEHLGVETRVQTAIEMREVAEPYIRRRAVAHLNAGRVVIFGAGTGNPFFTTDTAAALRAAEVNAQVFIKCTKVDGIFDSDPAKNPSAKKYNKLSYRQCTDDSLRVMDETAITLCKENNIPVMVLNMLERGNIMRAVFGEDVGTTVCEACEMS